MMKQADTHNLFRSLLRAVVLVAALGAVSCSKELPSGEPQSEGIRLEFSAALDPSFGPATTTTQAATQGATQAATATTAQATTQGTTAAQAATQGATQAATAAQAATQAATQGATQPATRGAIMGANFPAGTYLIGLAICKDAKGTEWAVGYGNTKVEMTVDAYGAQKWRFQPKGSTTWMNHLSFPENTVRDMYITAIYPYDEKMSFIVGNNMRSTYDLTTAEEQANQTDVMYSGRQKLTLAAGDRSRAILLGFKHFYTMLEFQIAPMFDTPSRISRIEVGSDLEENVSNKGELLVNTTGSYIPTTPSGYGPVAVTDTRPMTMGVYNTYRVMLPPVTSFEDGDIVVTFTDDTNLSVAPLSLPIKQEWLGSGKDVMEAGKRYVLKMLYNNAPTEQGSLTVTDWAVGGEVDDMWGTPTPNQGYLCWGAPGLVTSGLFESGVTFYTIPGSTRNSYNGYDNTQANAAGNGGAANWDKELPYYRLEVDKTDMTGTWDAAWTKCKQKAPAGQWRLPRESELMMIYLNRVQLQKTSGFNPFDAASARTYYWCGSENYISSSNTYTAKLISFQDGAVRQGSKADPQLARCVREMP